MEFCTPTQWQGSITILAIKKIVEILFHLEAMKRFYFFKCALHVICSLSVLGK